MKLPSSNLWYVLWRTEMSEGSQNITSTNTLFDRVISILEQARSNVVRAVNTNMVVAYWLIGREIVQEFQSGEERAEYGKKVIENLSANLTQRYGRGFSTQTLWSFRQFYEVYADRGQILFPPGRESERNGNIFPRGREFSTGFSPQLSWSHYRALMRVKNEEAREFYEREAIAGGWDKRTLERQIHSYYYERIIRSKNPQKLIQDGRNLPVPAVSATEELKNPYILEFLGIPEVALLHESDIEHSIINHLQRFMLELGNGFAFVARQKHIHIGNDDRYIDLVFYNCRLKFYLLIDLKVGELTHADVGQMDGYVRMYDELYVMPDDNPTIGLILCTEKNETVARYSVLNDRKQIFASKYMLYLPSEEQLRLEIDKERRLIEAAKESDYE